MNDHILIHLRSVCYLIWPRKSSSGNVRAACSVIKLDLCKKQHQRQQGSTAI